MSKENQVHWLENTVDKISKKQLNEITLSTGKTPSGHVHIGILREIIICDALRRKFEEKRKKVNFYLFLDDFDAAKRFPAYIDLEFKRKHLGKPFALIPCPFEDCKCESYSKHFGNELISTFTEFGIEVDIIWSYDLYQKKVMQDKIKIALEKKDKIKEILKKYILPTLDEDRKQEFLEIQKTWMPVMALCEKCQQILTIEKDGSIKPNRVTSYNEERQEVNYDCHACGNKGKLSVYSGNLKLNWRIDWPAKWAVFKTTCEPAGKDHSVKGGAYDTGLEICQKVFDYEGPIKLPYEWLRFGDKDMKTSKGIVFTPKKYLTLADPEIYRMLILRTNPMKHISLRIEELPQYHDYYDRIENIYYELEEADSKEDLDSIKYYYPLTKVYSLPKIKPMRISYTLLTFLSQLQNILSIEKLFDKASSIQGPRFKREFSETQFKNLLTRMLNWVDEIKDMVQNEPDEKIKKAILNKISIFDIPEIIEPTIINKLNEDQIKGILILQNYLEENSLVDEENIQNKIFKIAKETLKIPPKKMFEAIYLIILGKKFGPRLGPFLIMLDREWLLNRLNLQKNL